MVKAGKEYRLKQKHADKLMESGIGQNRESLESPPNATNNACYQALLGYYWRRLLIIFGRKD